MPGRTVPGPGPPEEHTMTTAARGCGLVRDGRTFRLEPGEGSTFFPGYVVVASTDTGDLVLGQVLTEPSVDDAARQRRGPGSSSGRWPRRPAPAVRAPELLQPGLTGIR